MARKSGYRIDKLRSDYDTEGQSSERKGNGMCHKLAALLCSLTGVFTLIGSFMLLRDNRLQLQKYLGTNEYSNEPFPGVLLSCTVTTTIFCVIQIISSLMFLFQDIAINIWKWFCYTAFMVSSVTLIILKDQVYPAELSTTYTLYFTSLIVNSVTSGFFLLWKVLCCVQE